MIAVKLKNSKFVLIEENIDEIFKAWKILIQTLDLKISHTEKEFKEEIQIENPVILSSGKFPYSPEREWNFQAIGIDFKVVNSDPLVLLNNFTEERWNRQIGKHTFCYFYNIYLMYPTNLKSEIGAQILRIYLNDGKTPEQHGREISEFSFI